MPSLGEYSCTYTHHSQSLLEQCLSYRHIICLCYYTSMVWAKVQSNQVFIHYCLHRSCPLKLTTTLTHAEWINLDQGDVNLNENPPIIYVLWLELPPCICLTPEYAINVGLDYNFLLLSASSFKNMDDFNSRSSPVIKNYRMSQTGSF